MSDIGLVAIKNCSQILQQQTQASIVAGVCGPHLWLETEGECVYAFTSFYITKAILCQSKNNHYH